MSEAGERRALTPGRVLRWVRRGTLALAVLGLAYVWTRFESFRLPEDRCSPLQRVAPGVRLWIDTRPPAYVVGDLVFFSGPRGEVWIGELARQGEGEVWITTDAPDCPGVDSESLGWVPEERLAGRVVLATRW